MRKTEAEELARRANLAGRAAGAAAVARALRMLHPLTVEHALGEADRVAQNLAEQAVIPGEK